MKIDNKFVIYKTLAAFKRDVVKGKVKDDSIVFVIEDRSIHTHDLEFGNRVKDRGFFVAGEKLPSASAGDHAVVKEGDKWYLYIFDETDGWVKTVEYGMPDITKETLDQYIKKENIQAYLRDIYNDTYVRRDEVYTPDQEGWDHQAIDEHDEWQWDEEYNLYRIDSEMSPTSRNAVQNRVITEALSRKKNPVVYDHYTDFLADLDRGIVPDDVVVYIKDRSLIYAFGTYFSGGSGGGGGVPVMLDTPILYIKPSNRDADISPTFSIYTQVTEISSDKKLSIELSNQYLHILVPVQYHVTNILTSNNETLSITDDFEHEQIVINGLAMNAYKYIPIIAPSMSLTFTFNIPQ